MKLFKSKVRVELILLFLIIVFGAYLRFIKLSEIPSGLYVDEALVGYNAYSIFKTGSDEYGKILPILFRFFGSYSPPLYIYLTSFFVGFFGLSIFSVRLTSVLSGTIGIFIVYLFLKKLKITKSFKYPIIGALVFAISPGAIFYSRLGYEVNLANIIYITGLYLLWSGFENSVYYIFALPTLVLSAYSAHTELYLVPLTLLIFVAVFYKKLFQKKTKKHFLVGILLSLLLLVPLLTIVGTPAFLSKTDIFYSDIIVQQAAKMSSLMPKLLAIPLAFLREFFSRFITYLSPLSLFHLPDPDSQRSIPDLSFFYSWMVIPYFIGLYTIWKKRRKIAVKFILLSAFAILFIGSLVKDPFSTQRLLPFFFVVTIVISLGIEKTLDKTSFWLRWVLIISALCYSMVCLWRSYFILFPKERAKVWGYGFSQLAQEISERPNEKFLIDQSRIKPAYIELAFFLRYPLEEFQKEVNQDIKHRYYQDTYFDNKYQFGNIETGTLNWEQDIYKEQILVGDELSVSNKQAEEHFLTQVFEIKDPLNFVVFRGFRTDPQKKCANTNYQSLYCKGIGK